MKTYINEYKANKALCSALFQLIMEDKESNAMKAVVQYLEQRLGSRERAKETFNALRNDIPSIRLPLYTNEKGREKGTYKFGIGVARMFLDGELPDGHTILDFNKSLELLAQAHANEYDNNLNGKTVKEINDIFGTIKAYELYTDQQRVASEQYAPKGYTVVKIPDTDTARKYSQYVSWCVTTSQCYYNSYTGDGVGVFYFFLKDGYQNVKCISGDTTPLDEYGLSMIAVSVNCDGSLNTITSRWNNGDHIMNALQLSRVVGMNVYDVCKPLSREELHARGKILFEDVQEMLDNGADPKSIFTIVQRCGDYWIVRLHNKMNYFILSTNKILLPRWCDSLEEFSEGYALAKLSGQYFFVDTNGNNPFRKTFKYASHFSNGVATVGEDDTTLYLIDKNGDKVLPSTDAYVDGFAKINRYILDKSGNLIRDIRPESDGYRGVRSTSGWYYFVDSNGYNVFEKTFFDIMDFSCGFAAVRDTARDKWYYIDTNGNNAFGKKFDSVYPFYEGYASVWDKNSGLYTFINTNGDYAFDKSFKKTDKFHNGYAPVSPENDQHHYYLLNTNGDFVKPLENESMMQSVLANGYVKINGYKIDKIGRVLRRVEPESNGRRLVQLKGSNYCYFIDSNGSGPVKGLFYKAHSFSDGFALVKLYSNDDWYFIDINGNNIFGKKFTDAYPFKDGLANVKLGEDLWDVINTNGETPIETSIQQMNLSIIPKHLAKMCVKGYYDCLGLTNSQKIMNLDPHCNALKILDQCLYNNKVYLNPNNSVESIANIVEGELSMNLAELAETNLELYQRIKYNKRRMLSHIECIVSYLTPRKNPRLRR